VPTVLLATRNAGKITELRRILAPHDLRVIGTAEAPAYDDLPETGATFTQNAWQKARTAAAATGLPAVADDSGLCVDALGGMPGVLSARWSGTHGDDAGNLSLLLAQLRDTPVERRGAAFFCAAAAARPDGAAVSVLGWLRGTIADVPRGSGGFGYDPVFVPLGETRTTAQMPAGDKDAISHRGLAFRALVPELLTLLVRDGHLAGRPGVG